MKKLLVIMVALSLVGCASAQRAGWIATAATIDARDAVDQGIKKAFHARAKSCYQQYAPDQLKAQECFTGSREYKAAVIWIKGNGNGVGVWEATNIAIKAAKAALEIAAGRGDSGATTLKKVLGIIKDAVCALAGIVAEYGDLFPAGAKDATKYLGLVKVMCK